jgi:hypothetical protein
MKKFIFIPVVNGFDLLQKACESITNIYEESIILNNSGREIPIDIYKNTNFKVITPLGSPLSFINTMNWAIQKAIDENYDYFAFMHNDAEIINNAGIELLTKTEYLIQNEKHNIAVIFTNYDVYCTYITKSIKNVGFFGDDNWPNKNKGASYFSDNDYFRRVKLLGYDMLNSNEIGDNVIHHGSMSIRNDENFSKQSNINSELARNYYFKKWGGYPGEEKFNIPFDN